MIRFRCTNCGWPVRVAQVCAGRRGRCPSCGSVIIIPAASTVKADANEKTDGLAALAAAVDGTDAVKEDTSVPAPPPPVAAEPAAEELPLTPEDGDESQKTEILPAEREPQQEKRKRTKDRIEASAKAHRRESPAAKNEVLAPRPAPAQPTAAGRGVWVKIIVIAVVIAAVAVAVLAVVLKLRKH
ncbi:MAG: hypothetical protein ACE15C_10490 [Phycisphaerae bacterium]